MEALDRVKKAHVSLMRHPELCLFSGVLACGKVEVTTDIQTAATDGWSVRYNPAFVDGLNDPKLRFLVVHEAMHKSYKHMWLWRKLFDENPKMANVAADYFVNTALCLSSAAAAGFIEWIPDGVPCEPRYKGWSVQQIFDDLKQQQPQSKQQGGGGQGSGDEPEGFDQHEWGKHEGEAGAKEMAERSDEIERALRHGEVVRKNLQRSKDGAGNQEGEFGALLKPKANWRQLLREFVRETCQGRDESTWSRPNRRFLAEDIYMPSMYSEKMEELVVLIDTSGSCFGSVEMTRFVSELTSIVDDCKPAKVHVVYVDTQVAAHQVFEDGQFAVSQVRPAGGGGTALPVVFDWCKEKRITPQAMVILTDGETPFGTAPPYPVLWAITNNRIRAPFGVTVSIE